MTAEMEFSGKNVKKALEKAAETLGMPVEKLDYNIVSHGSTGIFGLARIKKARIVVKAETNEASPGKIDGAAAVEEPPAEREEQGSEPHRMEDFQRVGEAVLRRMVDAISPESTITVEKKENRLQFLIEGGASSILIGKRGQTLEAMQLIVDKAVRRLDGNPLRLTVDVEGYRAKRKAGLVQAAERLAQKVASKGNPSSIGYLNSQDRRVVHLALKNHQGVQTKSVGEGPVRKLMIYPKRTVRAKH